MASFADQGIICNNLVIEWEGRKYIVDASASQVYGCEIPIKVPTQTGAVFVEILNWNEIDPPIPMEIAVANEQGVYYNAIELLID